MSEPYIPYLPPQLTMEGEEGTQQKKRKIIHDDESDDDDGED